MADATDHVLPSPETGKLPVRIRATDRAIRGWIRTVHYLRVLRRPGAIVTTICVVAYGALNVAKTNNPDAVGWEAGHWGATALIVTGILSAVGYALVGLGYSRSLKRSEREVKLYKTCRSIARLIQKKTGIPHDNLGVHVWAVAGPPGLGYLDRRATFKSRSRGDSTVDWRPGRGAIGIAVSEELEDVWDFEDLQSRAPDREAFASNLDRRDQMGLGWADFQHTKQYSAAYVGPVPNPRRFGRKVLGCVSVDVLKHPGAAKLLDDAFKDDEIDNEVRRLVAVAAENL